MAIPLLFAVPFLLNGVTTGVQIGTQILMYKEKVARNEENKRWWNDYFKNTGLSPEDIKYPYKSGYMDSYYTDLSLAYEGAQYVSSNLHKLYR